MKQVIQLDTHGYFAGLTTADESPLEPGVFLMPAGAIDVPEPLIPDGQRARWDGEWVFEDIPALGYKQLASVGNVDPELCSETIEKQGYVHLRELLDGGKCRELTNELKLLAKKGSTIQDKQCPKSQAVNNLPLFDSLLEQLTPYFEGALGKQLYPTYAYARLYAPGDELKVHTDRPACEISVTITIGFDGTVWPIFMGDADKTNASKIEMSLGDAVLYRGVDVHHWREPYKEGHWQAQVFLHYVDANGPYAEWKYDKRPKLAHQAEPDYTFQHFTGVMSLEACSKLIDSIEVRGACEAARIGTFGAGIVDKKVRDVKRVNLPTQRGVGATMAGIGMAANHQAWKFDITHALQTDYLRYDEDGHYHAHVDTFIDPGGRDCRKLTVLLFLNDDFEGGRLFLQNGHEKIYPPQKAGTALVFPSFIVHGVEPVTKGIRRSVVTWMLGPWFR
jgi:predicted 2-oxoglutarate/Fe(II)-dependent dioxygenase YbiX/alkylated DNA repair dioxygenase AlkB